jgi:aryl-alcohol dehydrogenase-like predicted oxidoreductase
MEYATLGNTGLLVSKLCFGTMTFGDGRGLFKAISSVGQAGADELVKTSIDGGINFFDTADNYTEGESEKILGQSLKNLNIARQDVVIATKVYSRVGPGRNDIGAPPVDTGQANAGMGAEIFVHRGRWLRFAALHWSANGTKRSKPIRQSCPQLAKADVGSNDDEDASTVARRILDLYLELNRRVGS